MNPWAIAGVAAVALLLMRRGRKPFSAKAWAARLPNATEGQINEVAAMARRLGGHPADFVTTIHFESGGTWDPSVQHPRSGATGLIQFLPSTARKLGTTTDDLADMSFSEQLKWVETYFRRVKDGKWDDKQKGHLATKQAVAMAVFYPWARYWTPIRPFPSDVRRNNPGVNTPSSYLAKLDRFVASRVSL